MNNDYTPNANRALDGAEAAARRYNHSYIGTEHLLCSILAIPNCGACRRFRALDVDPDELRIQLEQMIGHSENVRMRGEIPVTARTRKILELAKLEARRLQASAVGTEHIILAILAEGESVAAQILSGHGLTPKTISRRTRSPTSRKATRTGARRPPRTARRSPRRKARPPRSTSSDATSRPSRARASSTRSSAVSRNSRASSRFSPAARRTTPS